MELETFEECLKLAKEYLPTKERKNYYSYTTWDVELNREEINYTILDDSNLTELKALKEKYGDEFVKHLDELYDNVFAFCNDEILDIDLGRVFYNYTFIVHLVNSNGTITTRECRVQLRDDEYIKLLAYHLYDEHFGINSLRQRDSNLFGTIMREIDNYFYDWDGFYYGMDPSYITLDEAVADTNIIIKQHGIKRTSSYRIY